MKPLPVGFLWFELIKLHLQGLREEKLIFSSLIFTSPKVADFPSKVWSCYIIDFNNTSTIRYACSHCAQKFAFKNSLTKHLSKVINIALSFSAGDRFYQEKLFLIYNLPRDNNNNNYDKNILPRDGASSCGGPSRMGAWPPQSTSSVEQLTSWQHALVDQLFGNTIYLVGTKSLNRYYK